MSLLQKCLKKLSHSFKITTCQFLALLLPLLLAGCSSNGNDTPKQTNTPAERITLELNIVDENGLALESATANASSLSVVSQSRDEYSRLILELSPSEESVVLQINNIGYDTGLLYLPNLLSSVSLTVVLKERLPAIPFDGLVGGQFVGRHGAQVEIDGESLERADGSTATGPISLYINTVDVTDPNDSAAFPGSFDGLAAADTQPGILASLGVSSFRFEQNGERLQLKEGESAQLTIPLFVDTYDDGSQIPLGDLIPMWRLNEETGIWEEESTGTVVSMAGSPTGLGLQATTSHFSTFNADIWGRNSSLFYEGGANGPAGQTRQLPQPCTVTVIVPEFEDSTRFNARVVMNLGGLLSTRPISGIYYEPFTVPVFQGRPAALRLSEPSYNDNEGRSTVSSFTCFAETMDLIVTFDDVPAFFSVEAEVEPVFELVNGQQEITKNTIRVRAAFINDAMDDVHITTDLGYETLLVNQQIDVIDYYPTEPNPASIAFFLENELGTADSQLMVDYIDSQAPSVVSVYTYRQEEKVTLEWSGLKGADTFSFYEYDIDTDTLGVAVETDVDTEFEDAIYDGFGLELNPGWYMVIFQNQYGTAEERVYVSHPSQVSCIPNTDLPCAL